VTPLSLRRAPVLLALALLPALASAETLPGGLKKFEFSVPLVKVIDPSTAQCGAAVDEAVRRHWLDPKAFQVLDVGGTEAAVLDKLDELLAQESCSPAVVLQLPNPIRVGPAIVAKLDALEKRSRTGVVFVVCVVGT